MFRSRRSTLVKRLWKSRIPNRHETESTNEMVPHIGNPGSPLLSQEEDAEHVKAIAQSMLKRLKERHLEVLVEAVESRGAHDSGCVLLPRDLLRIGRRGTVAPHVLCCQIWRWPDLAPDRCLKRLPACTAEDPTSVCCNPYHWSLRVPESPPPCYREAVKQQRVYIKQDGADEGSEEPPVSTETGGTPTNLRFSADGSGSNSSRRQFWCNIAYWEHRERVGRLYTVFDDSVNVFQNLPHGDGMCLGILQADTASDAVRRTRDKIGAGLTLSREHDGLWMYNRSDFPVFVHSPTLEIPGSRVLVVRKVQPGYSINIYDFELSESITRTRDPELNDGPYDPNSIRISFGKGWGPSYSRQFITSCPCWIEVLLSVNR